MKRVILLTIVSALLSSCNPKSNQEFDTSPIDNSTIEKVKDELIERYGQGLEFRINRGVNQTASLWRGTDGTPSDFENFCIDNFISDDQELDIVFDRLNYNFEYLYGYMGRISFELNRQLDEDRGPIHQIDQIFGAYSPSAHVQEDFYNNKIASIITLNFPNYSLDEKNELGKDWNDRQWGFARLGDMYTARIPARIIQENRKVYSEGRLYISEYNVYADQLRNEMGEQLFPDGMRLLSHWNIRDEIKSNFNQPNGLPKQEMLYNVMLRIINQDIPKQVINCNAYQWNPHTNELFQDGNAIESNPEEVVRYQHLLNNFRAMQKVDPYYPNLDTYIKRRFDSSMEISMHEVESLFKEYASSPLIRQTAQLISKRLGRELRPFDLWYNGFVGRAGISEDQLDKITRSRYPTPKALENDLQRILVDLGFSSKDAQFLASKIEVDAVRGSGHAMRASMRSMPSHLRTRIAASGMDYKGYNIAIHEFGHNVEQTISQHMVDNRFINGIPNTAFTEALAFMFQKRDLQLLGIKLKDPMLEHLDVLDIFWDNYEMMGVSLVDMKVWEWLYNNPNADAHQLKGAVIQIAKDVWNDYYADVFGEKDIPLLAIYSHMIQSPLYLMNYPYGRLIMFQLEDYVANKDFAKEVLRIFAIGQLTPQHWMQKATGEQISNKPLFSAVEKALEIVKQ
jgi:hypothetical protein